MLLSTRGLAVFGAGACGNLFVSFVRPTRHSVALRSRVPIFSPAGRLEERPKEAVTSAPHSNEKEHPSRE